MTEDHNHDGICDQPGRQSCANRIPVEADKPAVDQGRYLHPDLYENGNGQPIEALTVGRRNTERTQLAVER